MKQFERDLESVRKQLAAAQTHINNFNEVNGDFSNTIINIDKKLKTQRNFTDKSIVSVQKEIKETRARIVNLESNVEIAMNKVAF